MRVRRTLPLAAVITLSLIACAPGSDSTRAPAEDSAATGAAAGARLPYPVAREIDQVDDYHGTKVADPYRWMEDLESPELKTWIDAQNRIVADYLADTPRDAIKQRLTTLWDYERFGTPTVRDGRYFFTRNDGLQNQSPVYVQDGPGGEPRLLIDPNTLSPDGTVSLADWTPSEDGKLFAYAISDGGSDWRVIRVRDVVSGTDREDRIEWAKFTGISWAKDGSGFYYSRYDAPEGGDRLKLVNRFQKLYFHKLGTPQSADALVYERKDQPDWGFAGEVSDDGRWLIISVWKGTDERNLVFVKDLTARNARVVELVTEFEQAYEFVGNRGSTFYFRTDHSAETYRVVSYDMATHRGGAPRWTQVLAPMDATLTEVDLVGGRIIANYLRDAKSEVRVHSLDGRLERQLELPGIGTAGGFEGDLDSAETFFWFQSYTRPTTIFRFEPARGTTQLFREPKVAFDPNAYETTQHFYASKDGTKIPMFLVRRKGAQPTGDTPTILHGYGGFNASSTPAFSPNVIGWLELGGIYAVANLRGGGEYGKAWHQAGMKTRKQNVFDDFAAAAEYLIAEKWTKPERLAISGRSNGGLLVAATMLQRPELFGAALPAVGVLDMLRFREFTIGWAWESDYGSVHDATEFKALHAYSPLHNIKEGVDYPPTLITTADHDDRVFPAHSFKFAAAIQKANPDGEPMLIRVETRAGHGAGKPTTKIIEEQADIFAFLVKALKMEVR